MCKKFFAWLFFLLAITPAFSQDAIKTFELVLPKTKVPNSLYKTITYLDARVGRKDLGIVDIGLLRNTEAKLVMKEPFQGQLSAALNAMVDSTAKNGELLFQLNRFGFAEAYGTRYCYLIADLYARNGERYGRLASIDTVLIFKTASVNILIQAESKLITGFIGDNLLQEPKEAVNYNMADIAHMDSIEMAKIPAFTTENYADGLYASYQSFKSQVPDQKAVVEVSRDGGVETVRYFDSSGKKVKVHPKDVYAVVYKGQPYVATQYGFYILRKSVDRNFYFTGDIKTAASQADISGGQMALGLIGAALASAGNRETYVLMVDYKNGGFIHLQKINKPAE